MLLGSAPLSSAAVSSNTHVYAPSIRAAGGRRRELQRETDMYSRDLEDLLDILRRSRVLSSTAKIVIKNLLP